MVRNVLLTICVAIFAADQPLFSETINLIECGESKGWGYYLPGGIVTKADEGWKNERMAVEKLRLVSDGKSYDLIFVYSTGKEQSASERGAVVKKLAGTDEDILMVAATYPQDASVEYFIFHHPQTGEWSVVWGSARGGFIRRGQTSVGKCKFPGG